MAEEPSRNLRANSSIYDGEGQKVQERGQESQARGEEAEASEKGRGKGAGEEGKSQRVHSQDCPRFEKWHWALTALTGAMRRRLTSMLSWPSTPGNRSSFLKSQKSHVNPLGHEPLPH
jgi:hypothetical protein